jgi:hypothetical protein
MVQVIDRLEDAGGAECIKFRVYRSTVNPERIRARWQHAAEVSGMGSIGQSQPGVLGVPGSCSTMRGPKEIARTLL